MNLAIALNDAWTDANCFGHTLQLAVTAGLELRAIDKLTSISRKIVSHFKHTVVGAVALKERQRSLNIAQHCLIQDVRTGWNSTYFMYERLLEQRWAIFAVIHDDQVTPSAQQHLDLTVDQWELLHQMTKVLKPLQMATTVLCKDQNVSSSLVFPVIQGLLTHHLTPREEDLVVVKKFKEVVSQQLKERFRFTEDNIMILAAAVDPRYYHLKFCDAQEQSQIREKLERAMEKVFDDHQASSESTTEPQAKKQKLTALSFLLGKKNLQKHLPVMNTN